MEYTVSIKNQLDLKHLRTLIFPKMSRKGTTRLWAQGRSEGNRRSICQYS